MIKINNEILKGIRIGFGIFISLGLLLGLVYAGSHLADQIIPGTFIGNFIFQGNTSFNGTLNISGNNNGIIFADGIKQNTSYHTIAAQYYKSNAQTFSNGVTTIIDFNTKEYDSNNAVTTGSNWVYTVPEDGLYKVSSTIQTANYNWVSQDSLWLWINKNGSWHKYMSGAWAMPLTAQVGLIDGSAILNVNKNENISIGIAIWRSGASTTLKTDGTTWISIERIGDKVN